MKRPLSRKIFGGSLAALIFFTHGAFAYQLESSFWASRRAAVHEVQQKSLSDHPSQTLSFPQKDATPLPPGLTASQAWLHPDLARVQRVSQPAFKTDKVLYFIQDIHRHVEAQTRVSTLLRKLSQEGVIEGALVEGAFDRVSLDRFHRFPFQKHVRAAANHFLNSRDMGGAVHAALSSEGALTVTGVDDKTLYQENVAAFRSARASKEKDKLTAARLQQEAADRLKNLVSPADFTLFDEMRRYHNGSLDLGDFIQTLASRVSAAPAPIQIYLKALRAEENLNYDRMNAEREAMLHVLTEKLTETESGQLLQAGAAYRSGRVGHRDFYAYLQGLSVKKGVSWEAYPALTRYREMLDLSDSLDGHALYQAIQTLEKDAAASLSQTPEQAAAWAEARQSLLVEKLVRFDLSAFEWNELKESASFVVRRSSRNEFINKTPLATHDARRTQHKFNSYLDFYFTAEKRDHAMAAHIAAAFEKNKHLALLAGGFHAEGIAERLVQEGVRVVHLIPAVTSVENESGEETLTIFAREKTPLESLVEGEPLFLKPEAFPPALEIQTALSAAALAIDAGDAERNNPALKEFIDFVETHEIHVDDIGKGLEFELKDSKGHMVKLSIPVENGRLSLTAEPHEPTWKELFQEHKTYFGLSPVFPLWTFWSIALAFHSPFSRLIGFNIVFLLFSIGPIRAAARKILTFYVAHNTGVAIPRILHFVDLTPPLPGGSVKTSEGPRPVWNFADSAKVSMERLKSYGGYVVLRGLFFTLFPGVFGAFIAIGAAALWGSTLYLWAVLLLTIGAYLLGHVISVGLHWANDKYLKWNGVLGALAPNRDEFGFSFIRFRDKTNHDMEFFLPRNFIEGLYLQEGLSIRQLALHFKSRFQPPVVVQLLKGQALFSAVGEKPDLPYFDQPFSTVEELLDLLAKTPHVSFDLKVTEGTPEEISASILKKHPGGSGQMENLLYLPLPFLSDNFHEHLLYELIDAHFMVVDISSLLVSAFQHHWKKGETVMPTVEEFLPLTIENALSLAGEATAKWEDEAAPGVYPPQFKLMGTPEGAVLTILSFRKDSDEPSIEEINLNSPEIEQQYFVPLAGGPVYTLEDLAEAQESLREEEPAALPYHVSPDEAFSSEKFKAELAEFRSRAKKIMDDMPEPDASAKIMAAGMVLSFVNILANLSFLEAGIKEWEKFFKRGSTRPLRPLELSAVLDAIKNFDAAAKKLAEGQDLITNAEKNLRPLRDLMVSVTAFLDRQISLLRDLAPEDVFPEAGADQEEEEPSVIPFNPLRLNLVDLDLSELISLIQEQMENLAGENKGDRETLKRRLDAILETLGIDNPDDILFHLEEFADQKRGKKEPPEESPGEMLASMLIFLLPKEFSREPLLSLGLELGKLAAFLGDLLPLRSLTLTPSGLDLAENELGRVALTRLSNVPLLTDDNLMDDLAGAPAFVVKDLDNLAFFDWNENFDFAPSITAHDDPVILNAPIALLHNKEARDIIKRLFQEGFVSVDVNSLYAREFFFAAQNITPSSPDITLASLTPGVIHWLEQILNEGKALKEENGIGEGDDFQLLAMGSNMFHMVAIVHQGGFDGHEVGFLDENEYAVEGLVDAPPAASLPDWLNAGRFEPMGASLLAFYEGVQGSVLPDDELSLSVRAPKGIVSGPDARFIEEMSDNPITNEENLSREMGRQPNFLISNVTRVMDLKWDALDEAAQLSSPSQTSLGKLPPLLSAPLPFLNNPEAMELLAELLYEGFVSINILGMYHQEYLSAVERRERTLGPLSLASLTPAVLERMQTALSLSRALKNTYYSQGLIKNENVRLALTSFRDFHRLFLIEGETTITYDFTSQGPNDEFDGLGAAAQSLLQEQKNFALLALPLSIYSFFLFSHAPSGLLTWGFGVLAAMATAILFERLSAAFVENHRVEIVEKRPDVFPSVGTPESYLSYVSGRFAGFTVLAIVSPFATGFVLTLVSPASFHNLLILAVISSLGGYAAGQALSFTAHWANNKWKKWKGVLGAIAFGPNYKGYSDDFKKPRAEFPGEIQGEDPDGNFLIHHNSLTFIFPPVFVSGPLREAGVGFMMLGDLFRESFYPSEELFGVLSGGNPYEYNLPKSFNDSFGDAPLRDEWDLRRAMRGMAHFLLIPFEREIDEEAILADKDASPTGYALGPVPFYSPVPFVAFGGVRQVLFMLLREGVASVDVASLYHPIFMEASRRAQKSGETLTLKSISVEVLARLIAIGTYIHQWKAEKEKIDSQEAEDSTFGILGRKDKIILYRLYDGKAEKIEIQIRPENEEGEPGSSGSLGASAENLFREQVRYYLVSPLPLLLMFLIPWAGGFSWINLFAMTYLLWDQKVILRDRLSDHRERHLWYALKNKAVFDEIIETEKLTFGAEPIDAKWEPARRDELLEDYLSYTDRRAKLFMFSALAPVILSPLLQILFGVDSIYLPVGLLGGFAAGQALSLALHAINNGFSLFLWHHRLGASAEESLSLGEIRKALQNDSSFDAPLSRSLFRQAGATRYNNPFRALEKLGITTLQELTRAAARRELFITQQTGEKEKMALRLLESLGVNPPSRLTLDEIRRGFQENPDFDATLTPELFSEVSPDTRKSIHHFLFVQGIFTIQDLAALTRQKIMDIWGMGPEKILVIDRLFTFLGLNYAPDLDPEEFRTQFQEDPEFNGSVTRELVLAADPIDGDHLYSALFRMPGYNTLQQVLPLIKSEFAGKYTWSPEVVRSGHRFLEWLKTEEEEEEEEEPEAKSASPLNAGSPADKLPENLFQFSPESRKLFELLSEAGIDTKEKFLKLTYQDLDAIAGLGPVKVYIVEQIRKEAGKPVLARGEELFSVPLETPPNEISEEPLPESAFYWVRRGHTVFTVLKENGIKTIRRFLSLTHAELKGMAGLSHVGIRSVEILFERAGRVLPKGHKVPRPVNRKTLPRQWESKIKKDPLLAAQLIYQELADINSWIFVGIATRSWKRDNERSEYILRKATRRLEEFYEKIILPVDGVIYPQNLYHPEENYWGKIKEKTGAALAALKEGEKNEVALVNTRLVSAFEAALAAYEHASEKKLSQRSADIQFWPEFSEKPVKKFDVLINRRQQVAVGDYNTSVIVPGGPDHESEYQAMKAIFEIDLSEAADVGSLETLRRRIDDLLIPLNSIKNQAQLQKSKKPLPAAMTDPLINEMADIAEILSRGQVIEKYLAYRILYSAEAVLLTGDAASASSLLVMIQSLMETRKKEVLSMMRNTGWTRWSQMSHYMISQAEWIQWSFRALRGQWEGLFTANLPQPEFVDLNTRFARTINPLIERFPLSSQEPLLAKAAVLARRIPILKTAALRAWRQGSDKEFHAAAEEFEMALRRLNFQGVRIKRAVHFLYDFKIEFRKNLPVLKDVEAARREAFLFSFARFAKKRNWTDFGSTVEKNAERNYWFLFFYRLVFVPYLVERGQGKDKIQVRNPAFNALGGLLNLYEMMALRKGLYADQITFENFEEANVRLIRDFLIELSVMINVKGPLTPRYEGNFLEALRLVFSTEENPISLYDLVTPLEWRIEAEARMKKSGKPVAMTSWLEKMADGKGLTVAAENAPLVEEFAYSAGFLGTVWLATTFLDAGAYTVAIRVGAILLAALHFGFSDKFIYQYNEHQLVEKVREATFGEKWFFVSLGILFRSPYFLILTLPGFAAYPAFFTAVILHWTYNQWAKKTGRPLAALAPRKANTVEVFGRLVKERFETGKLNPNLFNHLVGVAEIKFASQTRTAEEWQTYEFGRFMDWSEKANGLYKERIANPDKFFNDIRTAAVTALALDPANLEKKKDGVYLLSGSNSMADVARFTAVAKTVQEGGTVTVMIPPKARDLFEFGVHSQEEADRLNVTLRIVTVPNEVVADGVLNVPEFEGELKKIFPDKNAWADTVIGLSNTVQIRAGDIEEGGFLSQATLLLLTSLGRALAVTRGMLERLGDVARLVGSQA